ncbi:MAG TPA: hypothetical protein VK961_03210, partial [Chthoniobacter sp.]|nr:hypothetical protein [Chthoniobacter sp.]
KFVSPMPTDFIDITIVGLDPTQSFRRSGEFWNQVFTLSAEVPPEWSGIFEEVWDGARYAPKRHARIEDNTLVTICLSDELEGEHMQFLIAAVARTNDAYRDSLA